MFYNINNIAIATPYIAPAIMESERAKILNLEGTYNTRDLGGYKTSDGRITKYGVFLRSDDTDELTEDDIEKIKKYGVKTVIDFRLNSEKQDNKDKLDIPYFNHYSVNVKGSYLKKHKNENVRMLDNYILFIDYTGKGNWVKEAFDIIANTDQNECILFHCWGGRNKSGLLSMLLLGMVGVSNEDIANNYIMTAYFVNERPKVKKTIDKDIEKNGKIATDLYYFSKQKINDAINYIIKNYGSFENYLLSCGISQKNLDKIKNKFLV